MADMVKEANVYDQVAVINNSAQKLKSSSVEGTTFTVTLCPTTTTATPSGVGGGLEEEEGRLGRDRWLSVCRMVM